MPKRQDSDREVLTSLPRSRPVRRSTKRAARPTADTPVTPAATPAAVRKPTAAKAAPNATAATGAVRERPRVAPERKVPAAGYAAPDARSGEPSASAGAELVSTTIQAAAELAQIGLTVGRQTLQSMLDRLPKP